MERASVNAVPLEEEMKASLQYWRALENKEEELWDKMNEAQKQSRKMTTKRQAKRST